jgi:ferredoxin
MGGRPSARPAIDAGGVAVMKVKVDSEKCQGHNRCYALAPGLFKVDEFGYATPRGDGTVPPDLQEKAKIAVENCPERAIEVYDE